MRQDITNFKLKVPHLIQCKCLTIRVLVPSSDRVKVSYLHAWLSPQTSPDPPPSTSCPFPSTTLDYNNYERKEIASAYDDHNSRPARPPQSQCRSITPFHPFYPFDPCPAKSTADDSNCFWQQLKVIVH